VQIEYNVVHLRIFLVQLFALLQLNFEEVIQIIELRFRGAPNGYPFAALRLFPRKKTKHHKLAEIVSGGIFHPRNHLIMFHTSESSWWGFDKDRMSSSPFGIIVSGIFHSLESWLDCAISELTLLYTSDWIPSEGAHFGPQLRSPLRPVTLKSS
jgi:hypothetical protein